MSVLVNRGQVSAIRRVQRANQLTSHWSLVSYPGTSANVYSHQYHTQPPATPPGEPVSHIAPETHLPAPPESLGEQ